MTDPILNWQCGHSNETATELKDIQKRLGALLPGMSIEIKSTEDIDALTDEQCRDIYRLARRTLLFHLLQQETHEHDMDDCGDDLTAATDNWATLYGKLWSNDFTDEAQIVKDFLVKQPMGGVDGEFRYQIFSENFVDHLED